MKIIGPLHSKSASGTFANILTFSNRNTGQQCRFQRKQKDANTAEQITQRSKFQIAVCGCNFMMYGEAVFGCALYGNQLSDYISEADKNKITAQNQCVKEYLNN